MFADLLLPPAPSAQSLQLERVASLGQVNPDEWSAISQGCGLYLSWPYLMAIEESVGTPATYLLLRDQAGALVAGLPTYYWDGGPDPGLDHYEPFGSGARWLLGRRARPQPWLPTLLAGTRSGYATEYPIHPDWSRDRPALVGRLLRSAAEIADETGAASLGVMWLTSAAAAETARWLRRPEHLVLGGPNCAIEVTWDSFAGYLAQLSSQRRRSARRERERFAQSGLRVEVSDLASCWQELAPLAARLQEKYRHALAPEELARQLEAQARHLNRESRVILCRRGRRLVAFALFYAWNGALYGRLAGFDYQETPGTDAYFNLAFYLPIQLALDEGLTRLRLGMASWRAKVLRGARLDPAWSLACPPPAVRGAWARVARAEGDGSSRWWRDQFPRQIDWTTDPGWTRQGLLGNVPATTAPQ
ncbi:MAG TPA: GNAT family N-acetyltransferase [Candidatus Dormibacteraeota bacterium]